MAYPKYKEIEHPLLRLIYQYGDPDYQIHAISTYEPLAKHFGLSEDERLQLLKDGSKRPIWNNMIQWARLRDALIYSATDAPDRATT